MVKFKEAYQSFVTPVCEVAWAYLDEMEAYIDPDTGKEAPPAYKVGIILDPDKPEHADFMAAVRIFANENEAQHMFPPHRTLDEDDNPVDTGCFQFRTKTKFDFKTLDATGMVLPACPKVRKGSEVRLGGLLKTYLGNAMGQKVVGVTSYLQEVQIASLVTSADSSLSTLPPIEGGYQFNEADLVKKDAADDMIDQVEADTNDAIPQSEIEDTPF